MTRPRTKSARRALLHRRCWLVWNSNAGGTARRTYNGKYIQYIPDHVIEERKRRDAFAVLRKARSG